MTVPSKRPTGAAPPNRRRAQPDPVSLEVFNHRLSAIAEEMGVALCRSAFSPNIKERRDFSCALFDARGAMVAQAAHIPVHLGSTPLSVRAALESVRMRPGDVVMLNDPYAGGTHLPDVTVVAPVYLANARHPFGYVANRAHHADIGGCTPGSMPLATEIYQEGLRLPPVRIVTRGTVADDVMRLFLANTRVADERRGDLLAQLAALRLGGMRLRELVQRAGRSATRTAMAQLQDYSARLMSSALRQFPAGRIRCRGLDGRRWQPAPHTFPFGCACGSEAVARSSISRARHHKWPVQHQCQLRRDRRRGSGTLVFSRWPPLRFRQMPG